MDAVCLKMVAKSVRWLVRGGLISLDGLQDRALEIQAGVWLATVLGAIAAILLTKSKPGVALVSALLLSAAALAIGYFGYFTPFGWWPPIIYCQSDGDGQLSVNLNGIFIVPWLLGAIGVATVVWSRATLACPNCCRHTISFRRVWLRSTLGRHRCPVCSTECEVRHPVWYFARGAGLGCICLGAGYWWGGLSGLLMMGTLFIFLDALFDYYAVRAFSLLKAVEEKAPLVRSR